ncbi:hypothetical protein RFI_06243 [Reticulomyxa filosa]|uniref:Uncharacterized protein n=1 Tax=Reticulomyxa filosa TaxID=46433 RepID=X6NYE6_RETFI|nr:hypothetical protein RFI_06243 [Reticulomyxa filosa]|eukprot:ETO30878.1 hypothetical protein RFI_06243 [Reticulomyxa filosa]
MKASLVLVALHHVLNAFLVVSSVIFNLSKDLANGQTHSNYHSNMVIFATLWSNYYIDNVRASKTWKFLHCAQIYKLTILSDLHIFNKRSIVSENESIRFPTSTLLINATMSNKILYIKTQSMDMFQSILVILSTFCKSTLKSVSHRSNKKKKKKYRL